MKYNLSKINSKRLLQIFYKIRKLSIMNPDINDISPPPEAPEDYECCQNGCDELCVFEIYRQQKMDYDAKYAHLCNQTTNPK